MGILSLYRSDGIFDGVFRILSGPEIETRRKEITKICKHCDLSVTRKTILKVVDFEFNYLTTPSGCIENLLMLLFT